MLIALLSVWLSAWLNLSLWNAHIVWSGIALALLVAAGNIHNDIIDLNIDKINRPDRPLPAQRISTQQAYFFSAMLTILALGIGIFQDLQAANTHVWWTLIYGLIALILWIYNTKLKATVLWGNLVVAALCGAALLIPQNLNPQIWRWDIAWTLALFAFLINLCREIIKDLEDQEGDQQVGIKTLPLAYGEKPAKILIHFLIIAIIFLLVFTTYLELWNWHFLLFAIPLCVLPLKSAWPLKNLKAAQNWIKLAMLGGILSAVLSQVIL